MTTWYEELKKAMQDDGEDFEKRACTLDDDGLRREFDAGYGGKVRDEVADNP